ncbi:hypothetical protein GCM10007939_06990 [Amylibacter marinus]|uniref:histidine kinase n=1 Tax=Amylibacter marinus TaxID=1475483 RepID=A0ABQ5VTC4_9RHOB|nr:ATP-binding protein [Amylibacter marinus]GLQ34416.1 hypothetical protein GCM10007939_06990 [Amylibacter marinus]
MSFNRSFSGRLFDYVTPQFVLGLSFCALAIFSYGVVPHEIHIALVTFGVFYAVGLIAQGLRIDRKLFSPRVFQDIFRLRKPVNESALDELPIALLRISVNGRVYGPNRSARELLKIEEGEDPYLSDLVEGMGRSVNQWVQNIRQNKNVQKSEFALAKRRCGDVYLQIQILNVMGESGPETTAVITDATELKSMEAQFVQSQKMQAIGQLAGGVAHDFNNLLTAISGYCDFLMLRHEKGDSDYGDLMQISSNANRAAALVGQLLAYSRKQTLRPSVIQVNETLSDLTHLLNRLVGEKITLNFDQQKNLPLAFVDGRQLEQVIMNLIVNSRDAMPEGGEIHLRSSKVELSHDEIRGNVRILAGNYVVIQVEDQGIGIPNSELHKVFEPFFSTKEVGKGTGLGLSMAYGIMKQTGGYIFVDSAVNVGTTFTLYLPIADPAVVQASQQVHEKREQITSLAGLRVLLVEDEDSVRAVSTRALQAQGVVLSTAASGKEALERIAQYDGNFDVVVSDVIMPDMDGPTWVQQAQEENMTAKVIFVSGYAEEALSDQWEKMKDVTFLPKPYSLKALIQTVGEAAQSDERPR